jgi:hypothetical protein
MYLLSLSKLEPPVESDAEIINKFFGSFKLNTAPKPIAAFRVGSAFVQ